MRIEAYGGRSDDESRVASDDEPALDDSARRDVDLRGLEVRGLSGGRTVKERRRRSGSADGDKLKERSETAGERERERERGYRVDAVRYLPATSSCAASTDSISPNSMRSPRSLT